MSQSHQPDRGRRILGHLALLAGGLCVALVMAEGVARLVWEPSAPLPEPIPKEWRDLPQIQSMWELGKPNVNGLWARAPYRTNSAGFRGPERSREKPPGVFRIALIGDSVTMGWGVDEEHTYAARLERALEARGGARHYQVLNFGLAGEDSVEAVERFHEKALDFDPDLVIYGFTLNDLENEYYKSSRVDIGGPALGPPPRMVLWRVVGPRYYELAEALWAPSGTYVAELDENYFHNPKVWEPVYGALDRLAATTRERGMCGVVLIHTRLHLLNRLHPYHRHYDAIAAAAQERGLFPVRSFAAFRGRKDRDLWVAPRDAHPGAEAHGLLADALLAGLDALPAGCWERGGD